MAASDMMSALMELCQEKHIDQLYLIDRLEQSLAKSYAEILHLEWGAKVTIDRTTGKIYVYRLEPIDDSMDEEGNFTEFEEIDVTPKNTSRIAAQHAKAETTLSCVTPPVSRSTRSSPAASVTSSAVPCAVHAGLHDRQDSRRRRGRASALRSAPLRERAQRASDGRALPAQPAYQGRDH